MAHPAQQEFVLSVKNRFPEFFAGQKVLEVGSLDINGGVRFAFKRCDYTGVDVGPGKGVDRVIGGHLMEDAPRTYDVCISAECFEHNPFWAQTFLNMYRMLRFDGLLIFTCAGFGRHPHGTPDHSPTDSPHTLGWDYYYNLTPDSFQGIFNLETMFSEHEFQRNMDVRDLYFYGIKRHFVMNPHGTP